MWNAFDISMNTMPVTGKLITGPIHIFHGNKWHYKCHQHLKIKMIFNGI